jgi:hypothetical protein
VFVEDNITQERDLEEAIIISETSNDRERIDYWEKAALKVMPYLGTPLRPTSEDVDFVHSVVAEWLETIQRTDPTLLLLGITPELCRLPLDANSRVVAVDKSLGMIRGVWPGPIRLHDGAVCADWRCMPLTRSSIDIVLGDGFFNIMRYPSDYRTMCSEIRRLVRPGGFWICRCFVQPETPETTSDVLRDLSLGQIGSIHALKLRLIMALHATPEAGAAIGRAWEVLHNEWNDYDLLAEEFGWPIEEVLTIEGWRNADNRYSFPTLAQYRKFLPTVGFSVINVFTPTYELGERCPSLVLSPLNR